MGKYIIRRALLVIPTLLIASFIVSGLIRMLPGDYIQAVSDTNREAGTLAGEQGDSIARAKLGLDKPFLGQYIRFILGWPEREGRLVKATESSKDLSVSFKELGEFANEPFTSATFRTHLAGWATGGEILWGTANGRSWAPEIKGEHRINAIDYADDEYVWAVGENGSILHSNEGGLTKLEGGARKFTWAPQCEEFEYTEQGNIKDCSEDKFYTIEDLHALDVVDRENVWAVGNGGTILKSVPSMSTDEETGEQFLSNTWETQTSGTNENLNGVVFLNASNGFVVGDGGTIRSTTDGGANWVEVSTGTSEDLMDIVAATPSNIVAVGANGAVVQSSDGGNNWNVSQLSYQDENGETVVVSSDLNQLAFTAEGDRGFVGGDPMVMARTTDFGQSWENVPLVDSDGVEINRRAITGVALGQTSSGSVRMYISTWESFWRWGALGANLGESFTGTSTVLGDIGRTIGPTLQLGVMTLILSTLVAVPLGIFSAIRQDTVGDYVGRSVAIAGLAIPSFWLGTLVLVIPSILWDWVPPMQYVFFFDDPIQNIKFFLIPTAVAGLFGSATVMRMTRSMMLEVLRQDYIRTAWSKGLRERFVIWRHAVKNAMIPIVTIIGLQVPLIIGGQVIIERIFNVPGVGRLLVEAVNRRDYPILQGINLFLAFFIVTSNLVVDIAYGYLDPRIRYE